MVGVSAILTKAIDVGLFGGMRIRQMFYEHSLKKTSAQDWPGDACVWVTVRNMPSWTFNLLRKPGKKTPNSPHKIGVKFSES